MSLLQPTVQRNSDFLRTATYGYQNPVQLAVANSLEVLQYLDNKSTTRSESSLLVLDAVFQGDLFDGSAAWAAVINTARSISSHI